MSFPRRQSTATAAVLIVIAAACCTPTSTYDERMSYLRKVAARGVDTHKLLYSQEARIDKPRCERAYEGNGSGDDSPPASSSAGSAYRDWKAQVKEFFVDSC